MRNSKLLWIAASLFLFITGLFAQKSTVVIAEVLYDSPLDDLESTVHEGEFISLYNYEEDDVNIGGWRVQVTDLMSTTPRTYTYTIPANTILQAFSLAIIAPRRANTTFNIGNFYDSEDSDSSGNITLYTQNLIFPDTRSMIRIYDAGNNIQDELRYDGLTGALPSEKLLRATNGYAPLRIGRRSVSIQRGSIKVSETGHTISRDDYHAGEETYVQLYSFLPEEYAYVSAQKGPSALAPENVSLNGTVTKNQEQKASNITSSQVIAGGKTVYLAEEEVVLGPGFEVKDGAEFLLTVDRDSFHVVPILTYNLWGKNTPDYGVHAKYINLSGAAVVSVQEVRGAQRFKTLKKKTGMDGKMCITIDALFVRYGIGMLWDKSRVGSPARITTTKIRTPKTDKEKDRNRGWIVAEFPEFCFIATHLSQEESYRRQMVQKILSNNILNDCKKNKKPIYIAGDMNSRPSSAITKVFIDSGFQVLNDPNTVTCPEKNDKTGKKGSVIDLILEYNYKENVYHRLIERGIPISEEDRVKWMYEDKVSDHFPYFVKVKTK